MTVRNGVRWERDSIWPQQARSNKGSGYTHVICCLSPPFSRYTSATLLFHSRRERSDRESDERAGKRDTVPSMIHSLICYATRCLRCLSSLVTLSPNCPLVPHFLRHFAGAVRPRFAYATLSRCAAYDWRSDKDVRKETNSGWTGTTFLPWVSSCFTYVSPHSWSGLSYRSLRSHEEGPDHERKGKSCYEGQGQGYLQPMMYASAARSAPEGQALRDRCAHGPVFYHPNHDYKVRKLLPWGKNIENTGPWYGSLLTVTSRRRSVRLVGDDIVTRSEMTRRRRDKAWSLCHPSRYAHSTHSLAQRSVGLESIETEGTTDGSLATLVTIVWHSVPRYASDDDWERNP